MICPKCGSKNVEHFGFLIFFRDYLCNDCECLFNNRFKEVINNIWRKIRS
jgi:transposase-like protein